MNPDAEVKVVALPGSLRARQGWLSPADPDVEGAWLPVVGPACFVVWRRLAQTLLEQGGAMTISVLELAASVGMAPATGGQSGVVRSFRRLQRFGVMWRPRANLLVVRCRLPVLDDARLERLRPVINQLWLGLRELGDIDDAGPAGDPGT